MDSIFTGIDNSKNNPGSAGVLVFAGGANQDHYEDLKKKFEEKYASRYFDVVYFQ